jgi:hypothetical protein
MHWQKGNNRRREKTDSQTFPSKHAKTDSRHRSFQAISTAESLRNPCKLPQIYGCLVCSLMAVWFAVVWFAVMAVLVCNGSLGLYGLGLYGPGLHGIAAGGGVMSEHSELHRGFLTRSTG